MPPPGIYAIVSPPVPTSPGLNPVTGLQLPLSKNSKVSCPLVVLYRSLARPVAVLVELLGNDNAVVAENVVFFKFAIVFSY
jgi:hypothetical protein